MAFLQFFGTIKRCGLEIIAAYRKNSLKLDVHLIHIIWSAFQKMSEIVQSCCN